MNLDTKELQELKYYREKIAREYQESVELKRKTDEKIREGQKDLADLGKKKTELLTKLEQEFKEKQADLDAFKQDKKTFLEELEKKEIEIKQQAGKLENEFAKIQDWKEVRIKEEKKIQELNEQLQSKIASFDKKVRDIDVVLLEIKENHQQTKEELIKARENTENSEEQLRTQSKIIRDLEEKRKILNLKIEAIEKTEAVKGAK